MDPVTWLHEHSVDPDGDLSLPIFVVGSLFSTLLVEAASDGLLGVCRFLFEHGAAPTVRHRNSANVTPMFAACRNGHLDVAKWLFEVGASEDVRTQDKSDRTPMFAACQRGHLDVAQWLFASGAARDIRTRNSEGFTPMFAACSQDRPTGGHLDMAQWLFASGAQDDVRTKGDNGRTPMHAACFIGRLDVVKWLCSEEAGACGDLRTYDLKLDAPLHEACGEGHLELAVWLVLHGGACGSSGHVDGGILREALSYESDRLLAHAALGAALRRISDTQACFAQAVLPALLLGASQPCDKPRGGNDDDDDDDLLQQGSKLRALESTTACPLARLRGHEGTVLALIADFAGVERGRQLRNAREALSVIDALGARGGSRWTWPYM